MLPFCTVGIAQGREAHREIGRRRTGGPPDRIAGTEQRRDIGSKIARPCLRCNEDHVRETRMQRKLREAASVSR